MIGQDKEETGWADNFMGVVAGGDSICEQQECLFIRTKSNFMGF